MEQDLIATDAFESDEYRCATATVETARGMLTAQVYMPVVSIGADLPDWTLKQWTMQHKAVMLAQAIGRRAGPRRRERSKIR